MIADTVKLPDEPIFIFRTEAPSDPASEARHIRQQILDAQPALQGTVYMISDLSRVPVSFFDIVEALAEFSPMIKSLPPSIHLCQVIVGSGEMLKMLSESAKQQQYGEQHIELFNSVDDALAYIRVQA